MIKDALIEFLSEITGEDEIPIDTPPNPKMGDFSSSIAFSMAKKVQ